MAIYHLSLKIISRAKGRPAIAAAAYRAGEKITSEYDGTTHDYTRKSGVVHTEIMLPRRAPPEYAGRSALWNAVEQIEKANNAQLAREVEIALPKELPTGKNIALVREYVQHTFVEKGMCADIAIHDKDDGNPHVHIMLTMRPFNEDGTWSDKQRKEYILDRNGEKIYDKQKRQYKCKSVPTTDWNDRTKAEEWRLAWADCVNKFLAHENVAERIDHRSYARQGIEKIPTIHMGIAATQMEKRGIRTERGDINREINITNQQIGQLRARIRKSKNWLYSQPLTNAPTFINIMDNITVGRNLQTQWNRIANLQTRAKVLIFLQQNKIYDMERLVEKITQMNEKFQETIDKIRAVDRRLATLNNHLSQYDNYKKYKTVYGKYKALDPKKRTAFYNKHSDEIQIYETAKQYLEKVMNGRTGIPINSWKSEQTKLIAEKYSLSEDFYKLKDEIRNVEIIRRGAEKFIQEDGRESNPMRKYGIDL